MSHLNEYDPFLVIIHANLTRHIYIYTYMCMYPKMGLYVCMHIYTRVCA